MVVTMLVPTTTRRSSGALMTREVPESLVEVQAEPRIRPEAIDAEPVHRYRKIGGEYAT